MEALERRISEEGLDRAMAEANSKVNLFKTAKGAYAMRCRLGNVDSSSPCSGVARQSESNPILTWPRVFIEPS